MVKNTPIIANVSEQSSLINSIEYYEDIQELHIFFKKYYIEHVVYSNIIPEFFMAFVEADSIGKFYLYNIKPFFSIKKQNEMAKTVIKLKIDVTKINKDWLYTGDSGTYLNCTLLYNEEQDKYKNNGMIIQDVPTAIYKAEKEKGLTKDEMTSGAILGNGKVFGSTGGAPEASRVGEETGKMGVTPLNDDLPF